jgi:hypothetical protein
MVARGILTHEVGSAGGERLESYLNDATRLLSRDRWHGAYGSRILAALDATSGVANEAQQTVLQQRLQGVRLQIARKITAYQIERSRAWGETRIYMGDYIGNQQTIYGGTFNEKVINSIAAEKIEGSFNTVKNSDSSDALKQSLTTLHTEIARLVEAMAESRAGDPDEVADELEAFTQQAIKPRPLRRVLEAAGQGLVEAAKVVAVSAAPVAEAVTAVMKAVGAA